MLSLCLLCLCGGIFLASPLPAVAQQEASAEQLAGLLQAGDTRDYRPELFRRTLSAPDSSVRRFAAITAGQIGDARAGDLLLPLLSDPDSTVRTAAAFGLGLLRDTATVAPIIERLSGSPTLDAPTAEEAVTALARIGGGKAAEFFGGVLGRRVPMGDSIRQPVLSQALLESWRLGDAAPADALLPFAEDTSLSIRWRAVYALGRLRAPGAASRLTRALNDREAYIRSLAARALTLSYAQAAKVPPASMAELLVRASSDASDQVRINALRSLASFRDSTFAPKVVTQLLDPLPNVQVQAAQTLGQLGGAEAARALARAVAGKGTFGVRRDALVALARVDTAAFVRVSAPWRASGDWRERAAAAEGTATAGAGDKPWFLGDRDGRVIAAGVQAWSDAVEGPDRALVGAARSLLGHADAGVRSVAADVVSRAADPGDLPALVSLYAHTGRDSFPDAALSALKAIFAIRQSGPAAQARVDREFLASSPRPQDYLLRRWAEDNWPEAAARWGPAYPITTGRTMQDYRDVAQRYLVGADSSTRPHVTIETEQRGPIEIELLGGDAPLTVANFLRLVDRHFFDRSRWHRVVPNFVVQDGDPRGDGFGGPGGTIRDEINRNRYDGPMLGMALSGPDTGSSQWFINLSAQPHLDGIYTVFGRVVGGTATLSRITQGDLIRTIHR
jgi:cyclophilin family peptidyl-prolyl cis-trans isomerase/HEAT repeat protein